jgi:hypothetical protein
MERINIDNDAKLRIYLNKIPRDSNGQPYYIGKLQFPGELNFERGVSFMIFVSEEGQEEIQIAPVDPDRRSRGRRSGFGYRGGRITIDLHSFRDGGGELVYIGEAQGPGKIDCTQGLFFTVFTSIEDREELQIGRLDHSQSKRRREYYANQNDTVEERAPARRRIDSVSP